MRLIDPSATGVQAGPRRAVPTLAQPLRARMLRNLEHGEPACLTVTRLDALVLARSGYNHSADYRSVMAFGRARRLEDPR